MELFNTVWTNLLDILNIFLLMKYGFGMKFPFHLKRLSLLALSFFLFDFVLEAKGSTLAKALGIYIFMFGVLFATLPKNSLKSAFYLIPASLFYLQLDSIVSLTARYTGIGNYAIPTQNPPPDPPIVLAAVLADIFLLSCLLYLKRQVERGKIYFEITPWEGVFLTLLGFAFPFYDIVYTYVEKEYPPRLKLFWLLFCIGINASLFTYFYRKQKMNFYRNMSETYRDYYNKEYAQFLDYRESQEEADRFRHDMDNHFLVIKEMLLAKEYGKASAYMEHLLNNRELGYYPVLTGNEMLDMLIKIKYLKIESLKIHLEVSGNFHAVSHMEPMDICIIFSNAIDNAIEACEKVKTNRYIFLGIKEFSCHTMILMKNPVAENWKEKKQFLQPPKNDRETHGLGMGNIRTALEKYQGTLDYEQQGKEWVIRMLLSGSFRLSC